MIASTFRIACASLALALVAGCAVSPRAERYVAPPAGATWITQHTDSGSYGNGRSEVASRLAQRTWEGETVLGFESPQSTLLAKPTGAWLGTVNAEGKMVVSWSPPLSWDYPLEVGKTWTRPYKIKFHAQNREVPYDARQIVEAHEEVTVPAGTFKTFRVRTSDTLGNENVVWYSPDLGLFVKQVLQRTDKHPQGPGRRESELKTFTAQQRY